MYKVHTHIKSPNYGERSLNTSLEFLIMHYTACDLKTSLKVLTDPEAAHPVSAHYLVDENGEVYRLVDEQHRAWHAGKSAWKGLTDINSRSIGIEIVNLGQGPEYRPFPPAQMESIAYLSKEIIARHRIPSCHVLGHSDIAPGRKIDPGPLFDWRWLACQGVGIYPDIGQEIKGNSTGIDVGRIQHLLAQYGYDTPLTGILDTETQAVIQAFLMHFYPESSGREADSEFLRRLEILQSYSENSRGIIHK
jgi:N-acetylmuramoyl-L-alanine amidase